MTLQHQKLASFFKDQHVFGKMFTPAFTEHFCVTRILHSDTHFEVKIRKLNCLPYNTRNKQVSEFNFFFSNQSVCISTCKTFYVEHFSEAVVKLGTEKRTHDLQHQTLTSF